MLFRAVPRGTRPQDANWEPNFRPALPSIAICVLWLFCLCLTLPSRSQAWRLVRLASFPALAMLSIPITFERQWTLGNPLRDMALPTITWVIMCKAVELCLVYSKGGPREIRPFLPGETVPVSRMQASEYALYEWKEVEVPALFSWARIVYGLDVLTLRRMGTSPLLAHQGRALEWSKHALNQWSRYLAANRCQPSDIGVHSAVHRFGQAELPLYAASLQLLCVYMSFRWLYALAAPSCELLDVMGFYIPVGTTWSRRFWYALLPSNVTAKTTALRRVPSSAFELPLPTRLGMVMSVGGAVCLVPAFVEGVVLTLWTPYPSTAFLSSFEQPLTSPSLARLWARSWHTTSQRDYLHLASLLPLSRYKTVNTLYVFFWSGVQHSWMLARFHSGSGDKLALSTVLASMLDPGMIGFFVSQGVGILLEKAALHALPPAIKKQRLVVGLARRVWMFLLLVLPGFLFLHSFLQGEWMTKAILDGFGLRALGSMLLGKKY